MSDHQHSIAMSWKDISVLRRLSLLKRYTPGMVAPKKKLQTSIAVAVQA